MRCLVKVRLRLQVHIENVFTLYLRCDVKHATKGAKGGHVDGQIADHRGRGVLGRSQNHVRFLEVFV